MLSESKVALLLGYCGAGFKGMQRNPGAVTIEGALEEALFKCGAISECRFGNAKAVDWKRAARTDKGVSAAAQVVSGRFCIDNEASFVDRVNAHLPSSIRLFGYIPVSESFSAKHMCDSRRYEYLLPVFAFNQRLHRGRVDAAIEDDDSSCKFEFGEAERDRLNQVMSRFIGRKNYHNFSWRVKPDDVEAQRTVTAFGCDDGIFSLHGMDYVKCVVTGQSFMLYQIRKMIGLTVAVMRNAAPVTVIDTALRSDVDVVVPTAPGCGLLLDECVYRSYDKVNCAAFCEKMTEFKYATIYSHIAESEVTENVVANWLPSLNCRNYALLEYS